MGVMASGDLHRNRVGILRMRSHLRPQRETVVPEPHAVVRLSATLYRAGGAVSEETGCLGASVITVVVLALCAMAVYGQGRADAHSEFVECRTLLATADSATVHRTMPECHKWTLPPRDAAKGEG